MDERIDRKGSRARDIIDRIVADERFRASTHFSSTVYRDEPILTTGRQMAGYLPREYSAMKSISRWDEQPGGDRGRWLSEAELFYRQGLALAPVEDDCPYRGVYKASYPTYSSMSDRQLRGYVTWRTAVRRGEIARTSPAFALVYLQELICGIGVGSPREGLDALLSFAEAYRGISPEVDRRAPVWIQDYAVYHGLAPAMLPATAQAVRDELILQLRGALEQGRKETGLSADRQPRRRRGVLEGLEDATSSSLFTAGRALADAAERRTAPGPDRADPRDADLAHVVGAVLLRLDDHHRRTRKTTLDAALFGEELELPYTMFASAVFFDPHAHADCEVRLSPIHRYRCRKGLWTCSRIHGEAAGAIRLNEILEAVERTARDSWDAPQKDRSDAPATGPEVRGAIPKYLMKIIQSEVDARDAWRAANKPVVFTIDPSKLAGIRQTAAQTREALLIEEERSDDTEGSALIESAARAYDEDGKVFEIPETATRASRAPAPQPAPSPQATPESASSPARPPRTTPDSDAQPAPGLRAAPEGGADGGPLDPAQLAFLAALLDGGAPPATAISEDLLVDAVNEALFDLIGDTVIEFGADGARIIEDYRTDLEGIVHHG